MAVPDFQSLMLPVLKCANEGEARISDVVETLADRLGLSDEDRSLVLPSGKQTRFANRVHWARAYLKQAGLVEATKRGHFKITERGKMILKNPPPRICIAFLEQFPEFDAFRERTAEEEGKPALEEGQAIADSSPLSTPEEAIRNSLESLNASLAQDILERIRSAQRHSLKG